MNDHVEAACMIAAATLTTCLFEEKRTRLTDAAQLETWLVDTQLRIACKLRQGEPKL